MNQERVDLLTRLEQDAAPAALPCDRILSAMFVPALRLARDPERGGKDFSDCSGGPTPIPHRSSAGSSRSSTRP